VRHLHHHLHARVDRTDHLHIAGFLEGDVGRRAWQLRSEIEFVALAGRHDVVGHAVIVEEGERFTLLDVDAVGRECAALLMHHLGGGERTGRKTCENDERKYDELVHGYPERLALSVSAGQNGYGSRT